MNKIYKIIWSDVRKCYVVVAEIARNRGKNNVRTIVEGLAAHSLARCDGRCIAAACSGMGEHDYRRQWQRDGRQKGRWKFRL